MTKIELKYVQRFEDRHGKARYYFRRPGLKLVSLHGLPGSQEFMDAYQNALESGAPKTAGEDRTKPGTIRALIVAYYQSGLGQPGSVDTQDLPQPARPLL
jgi:hypothetical protein